MFKIAAYTDIGPRKQTNQDSSIAVTAQTQLGEVALAAVCDGVGGLSSGEMASASVVRWLENWFENTFATNIASGAYSADNMLDKAADEWQEGMDSMNAAINSYGNNSGAPLGTTCSVLMLFDGRYAIGHVGDSRVYHFTGGNMEIVTEDQTWVAQEVAKGNIPKEKARFHPKRNVILQSIGTQDGLAPAFYSGEFSPGDVFMICCDGFRNELFDDELRESFSALSGADEAQMTETCSSLVNLVLERGEQDNISVVCVTCQDAGE